MRGPAWGGPGGVPSPSFRLSSRDEAGYALEILVRERFLLESSVENVLVPDLQMVRQAQDFDLVPELGFFPEGLADQDPALGIELVPRAVPVDAEHEFADVGPEMDGALGRGVGHPQPHGQRIDLD